MTYYFYSDTVFKILDAIETHQAWVEVSFDLNQSTKQWPITNNRLYLDKNTVVDVELLNAIKGVENKIFMLQENQLIPLEVRSDGYYKLVPTPTVPTLEINGIKMHRSKEIDPMVDAKLKTSLVVKPGDTVLDTCGGLGYSAFCAIRAGASKVVSTENNPSVIRLRQLNPWMEEHPCLTLVQADINQYINSFKDESFHSIVHDPPRFSPSTGDLYGKKFYQALFRVLKIPGRLFHYTGSPKRVKHADRFLQNTQKRLEQTGFRQVEFKANLQGFFAQKNIH